MLYGHFVFHVHGYLVLKFHSPFQELSVKSSLSEFLVNSRSLLDVDNVHMATEAILRNEKPVQTKPNKASKYKQIFQ